MKRIFGFPSLKLSNSNVWPSDLSKEHQWPSNAKFTTRGKLLLEPLWCNNAWVLNGALEQLDLGKNTWPYDQHHPASKELVLFGADLLTFFRRSVSLTKFPRSSTLSATCIPKACILANELSLMATLWMLKKNEQAQQSSGTGERTIITEQVSSWGNKLQRVTCGNTILREWAPCKITHWSLKVYSCFSFKTLLHNLRGSFRVPCGSRLQIFKRTLGFPPEWARMASACPAVWAPEA